MRLDDWQPIQRLVVCCNLDESMSLEGAIALLHETSPHTTLEVWSPLLSPSGISSFPSNRTVKWITIPSWVDFTTINSLHQASFEAAILLTAPGQSPYAMAYACYLAGIPMRVGQSHEFGGGVLSHCVTPPVEPIAVADYHLHLLYACGFPSITGKLSPAHHSRSAPSFPAPLESVRL